MKLLANENIPMASVSALREAGYDILSITEEVPGLRAEAVIQELLQRMIAKYEARRWMTTG